MPSMPKAGPLSRQAQTLLIDEAPAIRNASVRVTAIDSLGAEKAAVVLGIGTGDNGDPVYGGGYRLCKRLSSEKCAGLRGKVANRCRAQALIRVLKVSPYFPEELPRVKWISGS